MTRAILFAAVAFVLSAAATTGVMVKLHDPQGDAPVPAVDSLVAAPADSAIADRVAGPAADPATPDSAAAPDLPVIEAGVHPGPRPTPAGVPSGEPEPDPVAVAAAFKQVARVLAAMKPPQAARVLSQLSDDEVEGILRSVGPRQAADFLTNLPVERAGVLSRRLLATEDKAPSR